MHLEQQVRDMLIFVRGDVKLSDALTIGQLLESLQEAMETPLAKHGARCTLDNPQPDLGILCNREVVIGALMNLVNNALQAAQAGENGGDIALHLQVAQHDERICLAIVDNGPGFDEATAARLNEPFYTTKAQGTGLGLAVVRAVAQAHHGEFHIHSQPGVGTRAELWLPLWSARSA